MIEGLVEHVSPGGIVQGWVRNTAREEICQVRVLFAGVLVAEAMAGIFRRDLLLAGHGHGHYGFAARLHQELPEGPCNLTLDLPQFGLAASMGVVVPALSLRGAAPVETLLSDPPGWTVADLLSRLGCVQPAGNLARMGPSRFVDAAYVFALGRWPSKAELRLHADNLAQGRASGEDVLRDLLQSPERQDRGGDLPSPSDATFPFLPVEQSEP